MKNNVTYEFNNLLFSSHNTVENKTKKAQISTIVYVLDFQWFYFMGFE